MATRIRHDGVEDFPANRTVVATECLTRRRPAHHHAHSGRSIDEVERVRGELRHRTLGDLLLKESLDGAVGYRRARRCSSDDGRTDMPAVFDLVPADAVVL